MKRQQNHKGAPCPSYTLYSVPVPSPQIPSTPIFHTFSNNSAIAIEKSPRPR